MTDEGRATPAPSPALPDLAWRPVLVTAAVLAAVLLAFSTRYGYHRDELYLLAAGRHLAWGCPDQTPPTPALARLVDEIAPGSLLALRAPSVLMAAGVVVLMALLARELGARRSAQVLAAATMAVSDVLLVVSRVLSTTTVDVLVWTAITLLTVRALRGGDQRLWMAVGALAGVGLVTKTLVVFLLAALALGLLVAGPRRVFRSGWPQLDLSSAIAAGGSGTSTQRWAFVPFQLVLIGPALAPVWIAGLVRLLRDPAVRWARSPPGGRTAPRSWTWTTTRGRPWGGRPSRPPSPASTTPCRRRSARARSCWPATTAGPAPWSGSAQRWGCRRSPAGTTASTPGDRRRLAAAR